MPLSKELTTPKMMAEGIFLHVGEAFVVTELHRSSQRLRLRAYLGDKVSRVGRDPQGKWLPFSLIPVRKVHPDRS